MSRKTSPRVNAPAPTPGDGLVTVHFDIPGVQAIGPYRPRRAYQVPADEAQRLVGVKGFVMGEPPATPAKQEG